MSTLVLLGDLAPVGITDIQIHAGRPKSSDSLTLANLEIPFCSAHLPSRPKAGPHLRGDAKVLPALIAAWPGLVVSLANNHTMDYGTVGLAETLSSAHAAGIRTLGAGLSLAKASAPLLIRHGGLLLGLIAATDRWFGLASSDQPGVNPLDSSLISHIRQLRSAVDRVIVSVHGGGEMSPWPSPQWQQTLRAFIEAGAHIVHAHHPHVPLGWERWQGGWIFYGLGNTLINPTLWPQSPAARRSWRVQLDLADLAKSPLVSEWESSTGNLTGSCEVRCITPTVSLSDADIVERNHPLADTTLLEGLHQNYAVRLWENFYADRLNPGDTTRRRFLLIARTLRDATFAAFRPSRWLRLRRDRGLFHYHLFSASTHAGEIATALGLLHGEMPDLRSERTRALTEKWLPPSLFKT